MIKENNKKRTAAELYADVCLFQNPCNNCLFNKRYYNVLPATTQRQVMKITQIHPRKSHVKNVR